MRNKLAFKVALGGIVTAVCLFSMFCTGMFPMLDYAIPTFAGFLMVIMIVETSAGGLLPHMPQRVFFVCWQRLVIRRRCFLFFLWDIIRY